MQNSGDYDYKEGEGHTHESEPTTENPGAPTASEATENRVSCLDFICCFMSKKGPRTPLMQDVDVKAQDTNEARSTGPSVNPGSST